MKVQSFRTGFIFLLFSSLLTHLGHTQTVDILGEKILWHKITLELTGPQTSESASPNPFTDRRMDVTFSHPATGTEFVVPGFFAADGDAANSSATSGNKWHCYFRPNEPGTWNYRVSFRQGTNVAMITAANPGSAMSPYDGVSGSFQVSGINPAAAPDLRAKGRLQYVGKHHLQFEGSGEYFLKFGPDSPENFLEYFEFDNTPLEGNKGIRHNFTAHAQHYENDGQTWQSGKGKNILGAVNYISSTGANSISMVLNNIGRLVEDPNNANRPLSGPGDGDRAFPYTSKTERLRFDCSKLDQWEIVFDHAELKGLHLHFKLAEIENARDLDGGALGNERRLYYREMIARFGHHLALNWNISEEIPVGSSTRSDWLNFFKDNDPWQSNRVFHTGPSFDKSNFYNPHLGDAELTGISLQTPEATGTQNVFNETKLWIDRSASNGWPWVVACDEQGPGNLGVNASFPLSRKNVLWGNIMAGGGGVEYYSGGSDLSLDDYAHFDELLEWSSYAVNDFFYGHQIPFWNMSNDDSLVSNGTARCLTDGSDQFVIYLRDGGTTNLNLGGISGTFDVRWFDPRNGGALQQSSVLTVQGNGNRALGAAPSNAGEDWAILVRKQQTLPDLGSSSLRWVETDGIVNIEPEHGELADQWRIRPVDFLEDPTMAGSLGSGWVEWTGPFNGGTTKNDDQVSGISTFTFEIKKAGDYTFRWRTKQYSDVEGSDAGNDTYVKFETGTPLEMPERDGNGFYTITKFTKAFVQNKTSWSYNAAFEAASHRFVNNPRIHYEAGIHEIKIAGRTAGHAIDRLTLYHDDVNYNQSAFVANPESPRRASILYVGVDDFDLLPAVDGRTIYNRNLGSNYLAINAADESTHGKFAQAQLTFNGQPDTYDIRITTITEIDGESVYRLLVNGRVVGTYENPRVSNSRDLQPNTHIWRGIQLNPGNTVAIESAVDSNGLIPEGNAFAFARGRWRQLELFPSGTTSALTVNAGPDRSLLLPTDSVELAGSANGAISTRAWTQVSGPNTATLSGQDTNTLTASSLVAGTYVFRLTATDTDLNQASDELTVIVRPEVNGRLIEFIAPFANGGLDGQQRWLANAGWSVDPANDGIATTSGNAEIAVLDLPITLAVGEKFSYTVDFEFTGNYATPSGFVYTVLTGLKASSSPDSIATGAHEPDVSIQLFGGSDNYRLLNNFATLSGASNLSDGVNDGDQMRLFYEITMGATAAESVYTVRLQNLTDGSDSGTGIVSGYTTSGTPYTGIFTDVYDALSGSGAYLFVQRITPSGNGSGLDALQVNTIAYSVPSPDLSQLNEIEFTSPFTNGGLHNQRFWVADASWTVNTANNGTVTTDTNSDIAVLDLPIVLEAGESITYSIEFEFTGTYTTPSGFVYTLLAGLKADADIEDLPTGSHEPDINIQLFSGSQNYRMLSNFGGVSGASNLNGAPNAGDDLRLDIELTMGETAAETVYTARLQNLTDSTDSGLGTVSGYSLSGTDYTGVFTDVFDALSGSGAYLFFQRINPSANSSGLDNLVVKKVSIQINDAILLGFEKFENENSLVFGRMGDDDGDGRINLLEYAFGGNPIDVIDPDVFPKLRYLEQNGGMLEYQFRRLTDANSGLEYIVQISNDLVRWANATAAVSAQPDGSGFERITVEMPMSEPFVFMRLMVNAQ
ncbi:MAG: DUF5060 domain-containing protein [Verrucomicrobiota bacterium]